MLQRVMEIASNISIDEVMRSAGVILMYLIYRVVKKNGKREEKK